MGLAVLGVRVPEERAQAQVRQAEVGAEQVGALVGVVEDLVGVLLVVLVEQVQVLAGPVRDAFPAEPQLAV